MVRLVDDPQGSLEEEGQGPGRTLDPEAVDILGTCWCLTVPSGSFALYPLHTVWGQSWCWFLREVLESLLGVWKRDQPGNQETSGLGGALSLICWVPLSAGCWMSTLPHPLLLPT